jgi:hypothetical protein
MFDASSWRFEIESPCTVGGPLVNNRIPSWWSKQVGEWGKEKTVRIKGSNLNQNQT